MKRLTFIIASVFALVGAGIILYDAHVLLRYGFDVNDVYVILDNGDSADWPTGLRPLWAYIPAFVYGLGLCLCAAVVLCLNPELKQTAMRRSLRGAE